jgi:hypothetical protein
MKQKSVLAHSKIFTYTHMHCPYEIFDLSMISHVQAPIQVHLLVYWLSVLTMLNSQMYLIVK